MEAFQKNLEQMGCSLLGRGPEPLVRAQFLKHPHSLNYGANHLTNGFGTLKNTQAPFFPHTTLIVGVILFGGPRVREVLEQS